MMLFRLSAQYLPVFSASKTSVMHIKALNRSDQPIRTCSADEPLPKHAKSALSLLIYHMKTIWLFTYSDLKTIVIPSTIFGILGFLCGPPLLPTPPASTSTLSRVLPTAFWVWINLLPSLIGNQRTTSAILEDSQNKPWRPLPSNRLSPGQAKSLMLACYVAAIFASVYLGGLRSCLTLICLAYCYNDSGVADSSCVVKTSSMLSDISPSCWALLR